MSTRVLATAGHVDHGKSTLVRALTGTDPDRLQEEKDRGLTIDLGFAHTRLPSGREVAIVDVPGHVRFLKNMLAGVGSVDGCLFVLAASEGWKPQSEEHLRILELLGVSHGVAAVTKVGLLSLEERELALLDVAERVRGSFLERAPLVEVDVPAGVGLDELTEVIDALTGSLPDPPDWKRPRLWIDRSFPVRGSGTIVTGTLAGGSLRVGDRLHVVPGPAPEHRPIEARIRGLQSYLRDEDVATSGRVAVNVSGVAYTTLERGQALVRADQWEPTRRLDATLTVLPALGHEVGRRGAYRVHVGSGQHAAAVRVIGQDALRPGETGLVRLHLPVPLPLVPGDRYVLREVGRSETIGGGEVLDVAPVMRVSRAKPDRTVERVVSERGIVDARLLGRLTGETRTADLAGRWVTAPEWRSAEEARLRASVEAAGPLGLEMARLSDVERAVVAALGDVVVTGGRARPGGRADEEALSRHPFLLALEKSPFNPPAPSEWGVARDDLRELLRTGRVHESQGVYFAASAVSRAAEHVSQLLARSPDGVTASEIRQELGTSRKYALPILALLDGTGVTRRHGDLRRAGPRLPAPASVARETT